MIDKSKETYRRYRERARDLADSMSRGSLGHKITVAEHATVQIVDGGAFVDAVVWVPEEKRADA